MKISTKQYAQTLLELTDGKSEQDVLDIVKKFVQQLKADGQLKNAGKIMEKFADLHNVAHGVVSAEITTKYKIQNTKQKEIEDFIKTKYRAEKVEMVNIIDESIGGGIIIKVGDEVLDASVIGKLKKLRNILSK